MDYPTKETPNIEQKEHTEHTQPAITLPIGRQSLLGGHARDRHITCGIEIELLLTPKAKLKADFHDRVPDFDKLSSFQQVAHVLQAVISPNQQWFCTIGHPSYSANDIHNTNYMMAKKGGTLYKYWSVTPDASINVDDKKSGQFGAEIVSRVLKPTSDRAAVPWSVELGLVWDTLTQYYHVATNSSCGTHVHFKIFKDGVKSFSIPDLKTLSKGIVYWGPSLELCVPAHRVTLSDDYEAYSRDLYLRDNLTFYGQYPHPKCPGVIADYQKVKNGDLRPVWHEIDNKTTIDFISKTVSSWTDEDKHHADSSLLHYMGGPYKEVVWNFLPLSDTSKSLKPLGTVEFRLPPGCSNNAAAEHWIAFLLTFAEVCFNTDTPQLHKDAFREFKLFMQKINKTMKIEGNLHIDAYENETMRQVHKPEDSGPSGSQKPSQQTDVHHSTTQLADTNQ